MSKVSRRFSASGDSDELPEFALVVAACCARAVKLKLTNNANNKIEDLLFMMKFSRSRVAGEIRSVLWRPPRPASPPAPRLLNNDAGCWRGSAAGRPQKIDQWSPLPAA